MTEFPGRNFSLASVKSDWLRGLGHFAKASLPLPDLWCRPSERTTDCRMAPIWPEHHWQLSTSGGSDCVGVSERTEDTFSIKFKRSDYLTWQQLCLLIESLTVLFRLWFLTNAKVYFAETSHHCLKFMWLSLSKIIFNSVKFSSW